MTARLASLADRMRRIALLHARPRDVAPRVWYTIRNADDAARAIVQLDGEIGWDVVSSTFVRDLNAITAPAIDLQINSPGGSAWDGYAIYNAIKAHPATVTVHIVGIAASAASFIAMAGDEIVAYRPSEMMIHDASGYVDIWGGYNSTELGRLVDELTQLKAALDQTSDEIAAIYAAKAGGTTAEWRALMTQTTWYTPDTALAAGLVDRINGDDAAAEPATEDNPAPGLTEATDTVPASVGTALPRARLAARLAREGVS